MDKQNLEQTLNAHGLTVLLTRDHTAMLLQLARLAQFERLIIAYSQTESGTSLVDLITSIRSRQAVPADHERLPMQIADVPLILRDINRDLHNLTDNSRFIYPDRLPAARAAFVGILTGESC